MAVIIDPEKLKIYREVRSAKFAEEREKTPVINLGWATFEPTLLRVTVHVRLSAREIYTMMKGAWHHVDLLIVEKFPIDYHELPDNDFRFYVQDNWEIFLPEGLTEGEIVGART